jgi:PKD repeat protein
MGGRRRVSIVGGALLAALALVWSGPVSAVQHPHDKIVSADPVNYTPHVLDGHVNAIVQIGDKVYVGGQFTQVQEDESTTVLARNSLFRFDPVTGAVDTTFTPSVDGEVKALLPAPDGQSIYVGGAFGTVNGVTNRRLTRLSTADGSALPGFTPSVDARVNDLRLAGGRLYVAGAFATVDGQPQAALATLDPATGAKDSYYALPVTGTHDGGTTAVIKMDVTPDETRLVAVGNFAQVDGQNRRQIVQLDLTGANAALANWQTTRYTDACSSSFDSYMRDVDYSPDGRFFVVTTTGAYAGGPPKLCDTQARWETFSTGSGLNPTWVNYTGGDTSYAVAVTSQAVYVGGHFRWANNPFRGDAAGQGAISREGIAALNPKTGLPFDWNPGRTLGVGVFDLTATPQGLWVGSDTDRIGNWEYHGRLAMFPHASGTTVAHPYQGELPADMYQAGLGSIFVNDNVQKRGYDGTTLGTVASVPNGSLDWSSSRGAFMLSGQLYTGWNDGKLYKRTFDGTTFGTPSEVNLNGLTDFAGDLQNMTAMFYHGGRIYFTRSGQSTLHYRWFNTENDVVGAQRLTASGNVSGIDFSRVGGMFLSGGKLYFTDRFSNAFRRIDFANGAPVAGTAVTLSTSGEWRQRGLFLYSPEGAVAPNATPTAALQVSCTDLACSARNTGSADPDGTVVSTAWDFGDGATASGALAAHTYAAPGTYTVTVTVTDDRGATATSTQNVTVLGANQLPTADFAASCTALACDFNAALSSDPDGTITAYAWEYGDTATGTGQSSSHTYPAAGQYQVKLTVTDDRGGTHSTTKAFSVAPAAAAVEYVGQAGANANQTTHTVTVPAAVAGGDGLLLFMTVNSSTVTIPDPTGVTGWTLVDTKDNGGVVTKVWKKAASPEDSGDELSVTLSAQSKADLTLVAYRGVSANVLQGHAGAVETATQAPHTTPTVEVTGSGNWLVSYWGEKSSATTAWTPPAGETVRSTLAGAGAGRVTSLLTDGNAPVEAGQRGGLTATADSASLRATMWSLVLERTP